MQVHIVLEDGFVSALGHRVALHLGGEPELKRRVLGTLAQLDCPPDEIRFERGPMVADAEPTLDALEPPAPLPVEPPEQEAEPAEAAPAPPTRKGKGRR